MGPAYGSCRGAWQVTKGSPQIVVAVIEPNFDFTHPDLEGQLLELWDATEGETDGRDEKEIALSDLRIAIICDNFAVNPKVCSMMKQMHKRLMS